MSRAIKIIAGIVGLFGTLVACDMAAKGWASLIIDGVCPDTPVVPEADTPAAE